MSDLSESVNNPEPASTPTPQPERWWVTLLICVAAVALGGALLLPPGKWKLIPGIALVGFFIAVLKNREGRRKRAKHTELSTVITSTAIATLMIFLGTAPPTDPNASKADDSTGVRQTQTIDNSPGATQTQVTTSGSQSPGQVGRDVTYIDGVPAEKHAAVLAKNIILEHRHDEDLLQIQKLQEALDRTQVEADAGDSGAAEALKAVRETHDLGKLQQFLGEKANRLFERMADFTSEFLEVARELAAIAYLRNDIDESRVWAERILEHDPEDVFANLAMGDILRVRGTLTQAADYYRRAQKQILRHAAKDPGSNKWQRDRSVSHSRIGDVHTAQGDLPAALASYGQSLDIVKRLAEKDPGNTQWQRDLSVSQVRLAGITALRGDKEQALDHAREALATVRRLTAQDPSNAVWRNDLTNVESLVRIIESLPD